MPIVLGLQSHSIPRRSNQLRVFPSTATMRARSTYSLLKPQHPSTGDPRAFVLGLGLGFGLSGHSKIFFFFFRRRPWTISMLAQQYISYTCCQTLGTFPKDRLPLCNLNASGFRRNRCSRHSPCCSRGLWKPRHPSCVGRAFARGGLPGVFSEHLSPQVLSQRQNTHMSYMCDLAINK